MNDKVRAKIAKVYELAKRGEYGEKEVAKKMLNKFIEKYNLNQQDIENIKKQEYRFKYTSKMEMWLITALVDYFIEDLNGVQMYRDTNGVKEIMIPLEYLDYVTVLSAYEYFRRHMRKQFEKACLLEIKRCRTRKTKNKRRAELQEIFFSKYIYASNLYKEHQIEQIDLSKVSKKELKDRLNLEAIEGGAYNTQVTTGLYLE
ncbi:hypothetical protein KORDIASMS9_02688 [Kordia sp. SMS9]|uniref:hypothetical protein n=1 Tax=Kordia sp. SMS9 TaxID=2282170 RepID=UPI000E0D8C48|nr:hypothetical protein [Kordia sp. SMS9]AXG70448.1 hypothetical protein KORDIASMS9_02688 [Kordia sp. SMS9]